MSLAVDNVFCGSVRQLGSLSDSDAASLKSARIVNSGAFKVPSVKFPNVRTLVVDSCLSGGVAGLAAAFPSVKTLKIINGGRDGMFEEAAALPFLRTLIVLKCKWVGCIEPLSGCGALTTLTIEDCFAEDLSPLSVLPLEVLSVRNMGVTDLAPLTASKMRLTLRKLDIRETGVADLRPLAGMRLTELLVD